MAVKQVQQPGEVSAEELFLRYRETGDEAAFDQLVHRFEREIYNYLYRYLRNEQLAEEVFQMTFLRLHEKAHLFQADRRMRPWLYAIATNEANNALRAEGRQPTTSLDKAVIADDGASSGLIDLLESHVPGPLAELEQSEWRQWTRGAIDRLPEHLRLVILLIYFQGLRYREAAEVLNVPVGTVKSRMHKALAELYAAWRREHPQARREQDHA